MKEYCSQTQAFTFLAILFWGSACNGPAEKELPKEQSSASNRLAVEHPKLIRTIGSSQYGNVQCSLQDKVGNLWFGTTQNGLYKYDGKSFRQFLVADGLTSNNIYSLLEDRDGKIWIGTEAGLCLHNGKTFAKIQIPLPKNLPPNKNFYYRNSHWVYSIMQAKSGKLWFVTIDGVHCTLLFLLIGNEAVAINSSFYSLRSPYMGRSSGALGDKELVQAPKTACWVDGKKPTRGTHTAKYANTLIINQ